MYYDFTVLFILSVYFCTLCDKRNGPPTWFSVQNIQVLPTATTKVVTTNFILQKKVELKGITSGSGLLIRLH